MARQSNSFSAQYKAERMRYLVTTWRLHVGCYKDGTRKANLQLIGRADLIKMIFNNYEKFDPKFKTIIVTKTLIHPKHHHSRVDY